jgi:RNA polymerase sigma-70 factor (ECF subfamily)
MPTSKADLTNAISRVAKGDRSAFEALYAATSAKLFGVVVRILVRRDLAEEVLQEVYLRVWQRAAEYDAALSSPITWLVAIARNRALDEVKRKPMRSLEEMPGVLEIANDDDPSPIMVERRRCCA